MPWNLERVLFWLSVIAAIFLVLSLLNHLWPVNPIQPPQRVLVGDAVFVCKFLLAIVPYFLIRSGRIKAALTVAAIWIVFSLLYGAGVLIVEQFSGFTVGIFLGELFLSGVLAYYSVLEARSRGLFQRTQ